MAQIQTVTLDAARAKYEAGVLFIDARPAGDFAAGHIRGAVNVPASKSAEEIGAQLKGLNRDDEVVVYCDGAECGSSTTVAGRLRELGFSRAAVFFGGWQEWTAARLPVAQGR
jgi:rhodanese-related sulfurtransferase